MLFDGFNQGATPLAVFGQEYFSDSNESTRLVRAGKVLRLARTHKTHTDTQVRRIAAAGFSITTQLCPERQVAWRSIGETLIRYSRAAPDSSSLWTKIRAADRSKLA